MIFFVRAGVLSVRVRPNPNPNPNPKSKSKSKSESEQKTLQVCCPGCQGLLPWRIVRQSLVSNKVQPKSACWHRYPFTVLFCSLALPRHLCLGTVASFPYLRTLRVPIPSVEQKTSVPTFEHGEPFVISQRSILVLRILVLLSKISAIN